MNRFAFSVLAIAGFSELGSAYAEENFARVSLGFGRPIALATDTTDADGIAGPPIDIDFGTAISGSVAVGRDLGNGLRPELSYRYLRAGLDQLEVDSDDDLVGAPSVPENDRAVGHVFLAGVNYDIERTETFGLFLGGGLGLANVNGVGDLAFGTEIEDASWEFAFQARFGLDFRLNTDWVVGADYAFIGTSGQNFDVGPDQANVDVDGLRVSTLNLFLRRRF